MRSAGNKWGIHVYIFCCLCLDEWYLYDHWVILRVFGFSLQLPFPLMSLSIAVLLFLPPVHSYLPSYLPTSIPPSFTFSLPIFLVRLNRIEQLANRVRSALISASADPTAHLYDPVNAFQLVNRFINGWEQIHDDIHDDNGQGVCVLNSLHAVTKEVKPLSQLPFTRCILALSIKLTW